jgi:ribosomal protein S6--L-glutamate ligase
MNILVLSTAEDNYATKSIINAAKSRGHKVSVVDPIQLYLFISNIESGYDRVYFSDDKQIGRINIKDFDAIICRLGANVSYGTFIVEHLTKNLGIFSVQSATGIRNATNKLMTLQICSSYGLTTPRTVYLHNTLHLDYLIEKIGGYPIIVKLIQGSGGTGVALLKDRISAIPTIQSLLKSRSNIIIQEYIESHGKDFRVIVIGNSIVASYQRSSVRGDFRANLQQGGSGTPITLDQEDKEFCIKAARAIDLNVAGIDIIKDKTGKTYLLEINANFGFKVQKITGVNIASKIIRFAEQNYNTDYKSNAPIFSQPLLKEPGLIGKDKQSYIQLINILKNQLNFYTNNPLMKELYEKTKGKTIAYQDRKAKSRQIMVNKIQDLHQIMFDTFTIN